MKLGLKKIISKTCFLLISKENYMNRCKITFCYLLHSFRQKEMKLGLNYVEEVFSLSVKKII